MTSKIVVSEEIKDITGIWKQHRKVPGTQDVKFQFLAVLQAWEASSPLV